MDQLVSVISNRLKDDFSKELFKQTMSQFERVNDAIRYNTFACNFRELTRYVLQTLAPDSEIKNCKWYTAEKREPKGAIHRADRIKYAVQGGLSDLFLAKNLSMNIYDTKKRILEVIDNLSKYTHIGTNVFPTSEEDGKTLIDESLKALIGLFDTIDELRGKLTESYEQLLYDKIQDIFYDETFSEIDILSTHHVIEGINLDRVQVDNIKSNTITVSIFGMVDVLHQYGSDMERARDDGLEFSGSYPFTISKKMINVRSPLNITISPNEIDVDNSSFFGDDSLDDDTDNDEDYDYCDDSFQSEYLCEQPTDEEYYEEHEDNIF